MSTIIPFRIPILNEVGAPLASLLALLAIPLLAIGRLTAEKALLCTAVVLAFVSITIIGYVEAHELTIRPFISAVYFFHTCLVFFVGYTLIHTEKELVDTLKKMAIMLSVLAIVVVSTVIGHAVVQYDAEAGGMVFTGSFLGMPLYGSRGYNALMVYFATAFAIILMQFLVKRDWRLRCFLYLPALFALAYILLFALSRQAILGLVLFAGMAGFVSFRVLMLYIISGAAVWLVGGYLGIFETWYDTWQDRIFYSLDMIRSDDFNAASSNRLALYRMQIEDIWRHPMVGNGFHGFRLYGDLRGGYGYVVRLSPHNQFLGALWKMGFVAATFYFAFLYRGFSRVRRLAVRTPTGIYRVLWSLCLVYLLVFCMTQDALLFPLTGALMMFLLGASSRIYETRFQGFRR